MMYSQIVFLVELKKDIYSFYWHLKADTSELIENKFQHVRSLSPFTSMSLSIFLYPSIFLSISLFPLSSFLSHFRSADCSCEVLSQ